MSRTVLPWWAATGASLTLLIGHLGGDLAAYQGSTMPTCIAAGSVAASGFAGLLMHSMIGHR